MRRRPGSFHVRSCAGHAPEHPRFELESMVASLQQSNRCTLKLSLGSTSAVLAELLWAHTPNYPDEPPLIKARRCGPIKQITQSCRACRCMHSKQGLICRQL